VAIGGDHRPVVFNSDSPGFHSRCGLPYGTTWKRACALRPHPLYQEFLAVGETALWPCIALVDFFGWGLVGRR